MAVTSARSRRPPAPSSAARVPAGARSVSAVGVRELRQNLSVYLDQVKRGASLQVTEHGHVVAVLQPVPEAMARLDRLAAQGLVRPATRRLRDLPPPRPLPAGQPSMRDVLDDLNADRV